MPLGPSSPQPHPISSVYENTSTHTGQSQYSSTYYNNAANFPPSPPPSHPHMYSPTSNVPLNYAQAQHSHHHIPRPQSTAPHSPYSHSSHAYSHSYSQSQSSSSSQPLNPPLGRARSHSTAYARLPPSNNGLVQNAPSHYEIPIPQTIGISSDYPSSPTRPFSCDLCALSFNRQHDLKRHRETHTGEKPYLCNGGCGKTFTRKDALKRHQLVKSCGKVDESWT
ncbi:hypothetical protein B0H34DRAFT_795683 [Crassisporium funariophilum]|nr:hypothetical protein B0H34DRAFT_795683 [Crassisporium funariophilum]